MMEKATQNSVIKMFGDLGYDKLPSKLRVNGQSPKIDDNFRKQMNRLNHTILKGNPLSDTEFVRLQNKYPKDKVEAFKILREGTSLTLDSNKKVNLMFIDKLNPKNNIFQVADEVNVFGISNRRLDLVVFVNGVPISNIEFKRVGLNKGTQKAINQINEYTRDAIYNQGLMNFIQIFAVSNEAYTRYFCSDPRADNGQKYGEQIFTWMDENNKLINKAENFIRHFFEQEALINTLFNYMTMLESPKHRTIIMRPNQIHAAEKAISSINKGMDCFISSSTGSGKTLTSFKLSQMLASSGKKVIMLLDRIDLADQTVAEFKAFDTSKLIHEVRRNTELHKALTDNAQPLVITTIQSFHKWLSKHPKTVEKLSKNRDVVFVVDECHRTTSGEMLVGIKRAFLDKSKGEGFLNCNFVGFTGTPLLEDNANSKETMTQNVFGESAHIYTITEAIRDKAVLPFKVFTIDIKASNTKTVKNLKYFRDEDRLTLAAAQIVSTLKSYTKQLDAVKNDDTKGFGAMLATDGKESALRYWRKIHPELAKQNRKTAIVFSVEANVTNDSFHVTGGEQEQYNEILKQHDSDYGTDFSSLARTEFSKARAAHVNDVINRTKAGEVDLLIVSDMLLTGFDCPVLSTIYIDKPLEHHGLLQAVSRTNRLCGFDKEFGNIVFFGDRELEEKLKKAIELFGTAVTIEEIIDTVSYNDSLKSLRASVVDLKNLVATPDDLMKIANKIDLMKVVDAYSKVVSKISKIKLFPEWDSVVGYKSIGTDKDELDYYYSNIEMVRDHLIQKSPSSKDDDESFDFSVSMVDGDVIDYNYLMDLLNNYVASPPSERDRWRRKCQKVLDHSSNSAIVANLTALNRVLQAVDNGLIATVDELFERLQLEKELIRTQVLNTVASTHNVSVNDLLHCIEYRLEQGKKMPVWDIVEQLGVDRNVARRLYVDLDLIDHI